MSRVTKRKSIYFVTDTLKVWYQPRNFENREYHNFLTITVMYIEVYIFEIEMSQIIHFWYQIY